MDEQPQNSTDKRSPSESSRCRVVGIFPLPVPEECISVLDKENLGILVAYAGPSESRLRGGMARIRLVSGNRLFHAPNATDLAERSRSYTASWNDCIERRIQVFTAIAERDLPDSEWSHRKSSALFTIEQARTFNDAAFLGLVKSAIRSAGSKRGRKPDPEARRRNVNALKTVLQNDSLKQNLDGKYLDRVARSQHNRIRELCLKAYRIWSLGLEEPNLNEPPSGLARQYFEELGFDFDQDGDLLALRGAVELGKKYTGDSS